MILKFEKFNEYILMISIFLIEFAIYTKNLINITNYSQQIINVALILLLGLSILKLIIIRVNLKKWIIFLILIFLSSISLLITKESLILQLCLLLICSYNIDFKKIVKSDFIFKLFLLILILVFYKSNNVLIPYFMRNGVIRYSYGFNQPNVFAAYLLSMFFEFLYIYGKNKSFYLKTFLFIVTFYFISAAKSRAAQLVIIIFYIMYTITLVREKFEIKSLVKKVNTKKVVFLTLCIFSLLTCISFMVTKDYLAGKNYAIVLDEFLSERILLQSKFSMLYDVKIFGNEIDYFDTLDNAYMRLILNFGIIVWAVYAILYSVIFAKTKKVNDKLVLLIFYCFIIYGLMEWYILRPALNIFILYASSKVLDNNMEGDLIEKE